MKENRFMTPTTVLAWSIPVSMWLFVVVFNVAVISLLIITLRKANLTTALKEKATSTTQPQPAQQQSSGTANDNTSYSRVTGMIGAVILVCFFWGVANVLFVQMFENPDDISKILSGVGPFFLSGSALFAPYAFNQISQVFKT